MFFLTAGAGTADSSDVNVVDQATQKLNAFQRYWQSLDWDAILASWINKGITLILLLVLFFFLKKIGVYLLDRIYDSYMKRSNMNENRLRTVKTLLNNIYSYTLFFFFIYALLDTVGVPVGSLLAGAGIAGVAIGLGAQGFMNDIITGLFIILEQQMDVGNYIKLVNLGIEGTVISIGIRSVQIKSNDGTVHYIPNRNITTISNQSRANMQVIVDVRILPDEGYEKITKLVEKVNHELGQKYQEDIQVGPNLFGMVDLGNANFAVRTTMYVVNGQQGKIKEEFLKNYFQILTDAGFTIPNDAIIR